MANVTISNLNSIDDEKFLLELNNRELSSVVGGAISITTTLSPSEVNLFRLIEALNNPNRGLITISVNRPQTTQPQLAGSVNNEYGVY
jgi:hypothetical protein